MRPCDSHGLSSFRYNLSIVVVVVVEVVVVVAVVGSQKILKPYSESLRARRLEFDSREGQSSASLPDLDTFCGLPSLVAIGYITLFP